MEESKEQANEAISAVVDDGFIGEDEDDDDYEDLYNDVNVGENFQNSLTTTNPSDDVAKSDSNPEKLPPPPPLTPPEDIVKIERDADSRVSITEDVKVEKTDYVAPPAGNGTMRINLGQVVEKIENSNSNLSNQVDVAVTTNNNNNNNNVVRQVGVNNGGGGGTMLFVGDLQWWTTDAEVEAELCKYGAVKEVRFFDEKASGKSKGYAQVEFHDPSSANACKEGMNGFVFNGRACVVAFASPFSIKRMGEAQMNRTSNMGSGVSSQGGGNGLGPVRRDGPLAKPMGSNGAPSGGGYQDNNFNNNNGNFNNNRGGFGRGNWGRGGNGQGMGSRGGGPMRNRPMMGRGGMMGNGFGSGAPMMPPQGMMGQGFDPSFGGPMGRMGGGYGGGFPGGPNPPFSGMMSSFPPVGGVGLPGVAPHVNPAFFGRGMGMNGMGGMGMSGSGVEGGNMGMWGDPSMGGGWGGGEEHRVAESSYAEEAVSDHQYGGEVSRERGGSGRSNAVKEKDRGGAEREWSGSSDKRYRDDREAEYERDVPREKEVGHDQEWQEQPRHRDDRDVSRERERGGGRDPTRERSRERSREHDRGGRDRHRDERERYGGDHHNRYKDRGEQEYDDEWDNRGRSSRGHNKSRMSQDEGQHFRSRDVDYSKRRRLTSE